MSAAFDTVDHALLLLKMVALGIRGKALAILKTYLEGRRQTVRVGGACSMRGAAMTVGVPQGSVLGPLLFLMFMNDLSAHLPFGDLYQYADDTTLILKHESTEGLAGLVRETMESMKVWCRENRMILNENKTAVLQIALSAPSSSILVRTSGRSIPLSESVGFLGVRLHSGLKWATHINGVRDKLSRLHYTIFKLRDVVELGVLRMYYLSCIESILSYGIILWGSLEHDIAPLFVLQKRCLRTMLHLGYRESCRSHFKAFCILTLPSLYLFKLICYCRKNIARFPTNGDISRAMRTRGASRLAVPAHASSAFERGAYYMMLRAYNALPQNIITARNFNTFRARTKKFLLDREFYSVDDFLTRDWDAHI